MLALDGSVYSGDKEHAGIPIVTAKLNRTIPTEYFFTVTTPSR